MNIFIHCQEVVDPSPRTKWKLAALKVLLLGLCCRWSKIWLHLVILMMTLDQKWAQMKLWPVQFVYNCLTDHWTQCAAQLCVPTVFASGYVAVSHLPVLAAISAVLTTPTSEKPAWSFAAFWIAALWNAPKDNVQVKDFTKHLDHSSEVCTATQNPTLTVDDILQKPLEVPMTATERNVAGFLIKKMMASSDDNLLSIPTRGKVNIEP